jgi:hypothetical protein
MKSKYLDMRNCNALLPKSFDVSMMRDFDMYLDALNSEPNHKGIVERLISHNVKTQNIKFSEDRLLRYDIDVLFTIDLEKREIERKIHDYYAQPEFARTGYNLRVLAQFSLIYGDGTRWTFRMPLQYLLKGWGDANDGYQCYVHTIKYGSTDALNTTGSNSNKVIEKHYSGITGRNWLKRLEEHLSKVRSGSGNLFHRAWRESGEGETMIYVSAMMTVNASFEAAMAWEEMYVDRWSLAPKGFNMIPGGFKGLKFLHKHRITDRVNITLEERERAIEKYVRHNPRKGIPNPFMSELWEDDEFYLRVMGARDKTLKPDQIRQIRALADMGWSVSKITKEVNALNERQVKNVLAGNTYRRIQSVKGDGGNKL